MYIMMYMVKALRTQIYLTAEQRKALDVRARREDRTMADLVREAIDRFLGTPHDPAAALDTTFGALPELSVPDRGDWERG